MGGLEYEQEGSESTLAHRVVPQCLWGLLGPGLTGVGR